MASEEKRITIGFLISGITDQYSEYIGRGILHAAEEAGVNLVIVPGKYLDRDSSGNREIMFEYQYNTLFSYVKKENLDALVIAADCIGCLTTRNKVEELLKEYEEIPSVLVASKIDGYVSVNYDNDNGIREGMEYLIHTLKCRKIGMIGGPDDNTDAWERKQVFLDELNKNGIPFEDRYYVEGSLTAVDNPACGKILDDNPDIEAIFCVNDGTAMCLYGEMKARGLVPGKDIKVFGYDDAIYAAKAKPSLSSVSANPADLGQRGVELALRMLKGEKVSSEILKSRLIIRNSMRNALEGSVEENTRLLDKDCLDEYFDTIFYRYKHENIDSEMSALNNTFKEMMGKLLEMSTSDEMDGQLYSEILNLFDVFLNYDAVKYADVDNLMSYFERVYQVMKSEKTEPDNRYRLRMLFSIFYRKIIYAMDYLLGLVTGDGIYTFNSSTKVFVRNIMQFDKGNDQSYAMLLDGLDWLDVHNAYIYTFEEPILHLDKEKIELPENLYLKATLINNEVQSISAIHQKTGISDIFDNKNMNMEGRHSLVMLPLFFNEMLYGILVCDMTDGIFKNGDFLTSQMGSAVKMIVTLRTNEMIQQQLEENLVTLRENNIELDNLSKSDMLTGILNRRGFNTAAERIMERNRESGKRTLLAYIDMNNLKIINDRYGHEEGDFSLKLIGDLLVKTVENSGVVGRIGGDEFACVMAYETEDDGTVIVESILKQFTDFNAESEKPYNVTVSVGTCVLDGTSDMGLKEALSLADEKLYIAKQSRVKVVAKEGFNA